MSGLQVQGIGYQAIRKLVFRVQTINYGLQATSYRLQAIKKIGVRGFSPTRIYFIDPFYEIIKIGLIRQLTMNNKTIGLTLFRAGASLQENLVVKSLKVKDDNLANSKFPKSISQSEFILP